MLFVALILAGGCRQKESPQAATALGRGGSAPVPTLHFIHDWYPEPEHGGYYAALLKGLWKDQGITVDVLVGGPNSEIEKRVALDPYGLGIVRGDAVFIAVERGLPVIAINAYFQHDPQGVMVRAESSIHSFADLDDRDVAMQVGAPWLVYLQKKYSLSKLRVRPVTGSVANFVKDPNWITQAYPTCEPYYAAKEGVPARVLQISESGFDPYRVIIANKELVTKHPELVAKFSRGAYLGWKEYFRDPQPIHDHILKISPVMEMGGMRYSYVKMRELRLVEGDAAKGEHLGAFDRKRWEELGRILLDLRVIEKAVPISEVVTFDYSSDALGVDGTLPKPVWTEAPIPGR